MAPMHSIAIVFCAVEPEPHEALPNGASDETNDMVNIDVSHMLVTA